VEPAIRERKDDQEKDLKKGGQKETLGRLGI